MQFDEVVRARRMVRRFDPTGRVPRETVAELLDLATRAPSAGFTQGWQFLVLDDPADTDRYWTLTAPDGAVDAWLTGMRSAPVLILALADPGRYATRYARPDKTRSPLAVTSGAPVEDRWPVPWWDVDTGMAVLLTLLGAVDRGLGGCLAGIPADRWHDVRSAFGIPPDLRGVAVVALGHPAPGAARGRGRARREPADVVRWSRYG